MVRVGFFGRLTLSVVLAATALTGYAAPADGVRAGTAMKNIAGARRAELLPADLKYYVLAAENWVQPGGVVQCYGGSHQVGHELNPVYGDDGAGGSEQKFGLVADPLGSGALAYVAAVRDSDPDTANPGSKRCEYAIGGAGKNLPWDKDFWFGVSVLTSSWKKTADQQIIWQWHDGSQVQGLSPFLAAVVQGDRIQIQLRRNYQAPLLPENTECEVIFEGAWKANKWTNFVVNARVDTKIPSNGFVRIWLNGLLISNYAGAFGYGYSQANDYAKVGYYHWAWSNAWDERIPLREVYFRSIALVEGRPGYTWKLIDRMLAPGP